MENQNDINNSTLDFDFMPTQENHSIIKVVGVGGGGSNAVEHMYETGIEDVSFLIINTDKQALNRSAIPNKLLISEKGLGAGANPTAARAYAEQFSDQIRQALSDGTEMVFITAGMGGGTGTGAAPIVAQISHELNILTVGIVTIPFKFEGKKKILMALDGVRAIEKWCDALLVVNNNRLIDIYPDLNFGNAFGKADDTLTTAAKSISDIINKVGYINLDFADVSTTLRNGGVALISTGSAMGEGRLSKAIEAARTSPLLQDNKITDAKHLLFELCFSHKNPLTMNEIAEMNHFVDGLNSDIEVIWGAMYDDELGDNVRIILLASGFAMNHNTGDIIVGAQLEDKVKQLQQKLRIAIAERKNQVGEFDGYPEAADILLNALRRAADKAELFTIDDSLDEEIAKLDIAYQNACDKKIEAIRAAEAEMERLKQMEREREIRETIAALEAQLNESIAKAKAKAETAATATVDTKPKAPTSATVDTKPKTPASVTVDTKPKTPTTTRVETPAPAPAEVKPKTQTPAPAEVKAEMPSSVIEPDIFSQPEPTPIKPVAPEPVAKPVAPEPVAKPVAPEPVAKPEPTTTAQPATHIISDDSDGLEAIRHFYGDETANRMLLDDIRKAYYILDEQELTNMELIDRLEHLPAYARKTSDLNSLRLASKQPAKPRPIAQHDPVEKTLGI